MKHTPYFLYLKDFLFTLPFTMALPGLIPVISPFPPSWLSAGNLPDPESITSASAWLCPVPAPAYGQVPTAWALPDSLTSAGAGRGVLLLPAPRDPSRSKAESDPAADSAACLLTQITGSCCRLALEIWRGDRLEQLPPRRDGNRAVGGGTRGRCLMMFMKDLLWLPRQLEPKDWHPGRDALGREPADRDLYPQSGSRVWHPGTGTQGLVSTMPQQPLGQHMALLHVRGSGNS